MRISGTQSGVIELVIDLTVFGSLKTWSMPISEKTDVMIRAGRSSGS